MTTKNYQRWDDADKLMRLVDRMLSKNPNVIAIDVETGYVGPERSGISLQPYHPDFRLVSFQFTPSKDYALYIPIGHDQGDNMDPLGAARALWKICSSGLCIAHNASFEENALARFFREQLWDDEEYGAAVRESLGFFKCKSDTMIEAYMLAEYETIGLKDLTHRVLKQEQAEIISLFPNLKKKTALRFNTLDMYDQAVIDYACDDVTTAIQLHELHYPQVKDMFMFKIEIALTPVLCWMEYEALELDWAEYQRQEAQITKFRELKNEEILKDFSERLERQVVVNFQSPQQVAKLLYEDLKLPINERNRTDTGAPGTGEGALRALAKKDPGIKGILELREINKLRSSYITKYLKEFQYAEDGRAHPNHNQAGAGTGRMSVSGVSYQQWPKPYHYELSDGTTYDLNYRDFLIAPEGYRIVGYDFSQVELRILAGMANEQALLKAFYDDVDIHRATASSMMKIPLDEVTKKQRSQGKTLNFAVVYGSGAANIGEMLGIPKEEAQELLDTYFATFSGLKSWMDSKVVEGRQQRYVETVFGRKYRLWEYTKPESWQQSAGDRLCVNAPVQGGAADYMKIGMVRVHQTLKKAGLLDKVRLIMTIHDALEFYVHESVSTQEVIDLLNPAVSFPVPNNPHFPEIRADWHEGKRWGSVVEIKTDKAKQITGYGIEDVDQEFATIEEAYAYLDAHKTPNGMNAPLTVTVTSTPEGEPGLAETMGWPPHPEQLPQDDVPMVFAEPVAATPDLTEFLETAWDVIPDAHELEEEPPWLHAKDVEPPKEEFSAPKRLILELQAMPLVEPWEKFQSFISALPGETTLTVSTPEGDFEMGEFALDEKDIAEIKKILAGSRILLPSGV